MNVAQKLNKIQIILKQMESLKSVNESEYLSNEISQLSNRISDNVFRIAVVGEFSSGKSTFINALIGKDILSHARQETTATITYIQNVQENDHRRGTGLVAFRDGRTKELDHFEDIKTYTTAQSDGKVAETISSVTLFVHFLGVDEPVLLVDTPGLNGTAEHHREITLEEIKKAHACFYLLDSKGITESDRSLIRLLSDYQNSFLFLQNSIDMLDISEGDTPEKKIERDEEDIQKYFINQGINLHHKVLGISALKALASRDTSIKKLYSDEFAKEITESDRPRLYQESRFSQLEQYIEDLITTGKYKEVIIDSVFKRLRVLLEGLLGKLDEEQQLNQAMREHDEDTKRIQAAQDILQKIQNTQEDRERRISNFVKSLSADQRRMLENEIKSQLQKLYESICDQIDCEIPNYQSYLDFSKTHGKGISAYFSQLIEKQLKDKYTQEFIGDANLLLHHIYEKTIARVEAYTSRKSVPVDIHFIIDSPTEVFEMEDNETMNAIEDTQRRIQRSKKKLETLRTEINEIEVRKKTARQAEQVAQSAYDSCKRAKKSELAALGSRPSAKEWTTYHYEDDPRDGFFGKIADFFNTRQKKVPDYHYDDSEGERWVLNNSGIHRKYAGRERELYSNLEDTIGIRESLEADIRQKQAQCRNCESDISSYQAQMRKLREIYDNEVKLSQGKFCERQKGLVKTSIEDRLLNISNPTSTITYYIEYLRGIFERYESIIIQKGIEAFHKNVAEQIASLKSMIDQHEDDLAKRYQSNKDECAIIQSIFDEIEKISI